MAQVEVVVADQVMTLTLNRPERLNGFTEQMMHELLDALDEADRDDDVRAVIFTGAGRAFCAGADLSTGDATFDPARRAAEDAERAPSGARRDGGGRVALRIYQLHKPVIAAINGPAVGVGITMCLPMDVRIAAEGARRRQRWPHHVADT